MVVSLNGEPGVAGDGIVMDSWHGVREQLAELGESVEAAVLAFDVDGAADKVLLLWPRIVVSPDL